MDNGVASAPCTGTQRYIQPWKARITGFFTLLPEGRRSELVREDRVSDDRFSAIVPALSRTSSLLPPPARIKNRLVYNEERLGIGSDDAFFLDGPLMKHAR